MQNIITLMLEHKSAVVICAVAIVGIVLSFLYLKRLESKQSKQD